MLGSPSSCYVLQWDPRGSSQPGPPPGLMIFGHLRRVASQVRSASVGCVGILCRACQVCVRPHTEPLSGRSSCELRGTSLKKFPEPVVSRAFPRNHKHAPANALDLLSLSRSGGDVHPVPAPREFSAGGLPARAKELQETGGGSKTQ